LLRLSTRNARIDQDYRKNERVKRLTSETDETCADLSVKDTIDCLREVLEAVLDSREGLDYLLHLVFILNKD